MTVVCSGSMLGRRSRMFVVAALAVATGMWLTSCTATGPTVTSSGRYVAVIDAPETASADAVIFGTLDVDGNGCWALRDSDGRIHEVIWPTGTRIAGNTLSLPGLRTAVGIGTSLTGGGGVVPGSKSFPPCVARGDDVISISDITLAP